MRTLRLLTRFLRREDGISLIMAVGILSVLSVSGSSLVYYADTNHRTAVYSRGNGSAYDLAEAGINEMMSVLSNGKNNALKGNLLPSTTHTFGTGTVTWSGTLNDSTQTWTLTSTGQVVNSSGPGARAITRTLTAKVPVTPNYTQPLNNPVWNYIFSTRTGTPGGCDETLNNNVGGGSRLYVNGNLCLGNNAIVTATALVVRQKLSLGNNAAVGASSSMSTRVETYVGGSGGQYCKYGNQAWDPSGGHPFCSDYDHVYSKLSSGGIGVSSNPPVMAAPAVDWDTWYANSMPGPSADCSNSNGAKSGTTPTWDNNGVRNTGNGSVTTVFDLTPASSYTCRVGPPSSPTGELSWNASTKVLTVAGTMFIDGSAKVTNGALNQYNGQATLYISGTLLMNGKLCGGTNGTDCDFANWNPNTEMLTFVVGGDGANGNGGQQVPAGESIDFANNSSFQGALYATNAIMMGNNTKSDGPMVGGWIGFSNNVTSDNFPTITTVPVGMPGNPAVYAQPNPPELYAG
jgi:hypothetical protein